MAKPIYQQIWANNASTTLVGALATGVTSCTVADGGVFGVGLSTVYLHVATIDDGVAEPEVVHIVGRSGNNLTLQRAQEGTSSPASFADGTTIELRTTAQSLDLLDATKASFNGSLEIGYGADTDASGAIAIGHGAYSGEGVSGSSSHKNQIAIGFGAKTAWQGSIAIGENANAQGAGSGDTSGIAIGEGSQSTGNSSIHIGEGNETTSGLTTGDYALTIGAFSKNEGDNTVLIGYTTEVAAAADNSVAIGYDGTCGSASSVAIGDTIVIAVSSAYSVAIGRAAAVDGASTIAIGNVASAVGADNMAIGSNARADIGADSVAIGHGSNALAGESVAIGPYAEAYAAGTFRSWGPSIIQRPANWWYHQTEVSPMLGGQALISSPPCDLGPGIAWSGTTYDDCEVVEPTTPTGTEQYYLSLGTYDADPSVTNQVTEPGTTEPTWPIVAQGDSIRTEFSAADIWVMIDPESGMDIAADKLSYQGGGGVLFYPTRAAFVCQKYGTMTATPYVSVGNESSATAYVNNQQLTNITAADKTQWFDITNPDGATNIIFTLVTRGTGGSGKCQGRFLVQGFYMQKMG